MTVALPCRVNSVHTGFKVGESVSMLVLGMLAVAQLQ